MQAFLNEQFATPESTWPALATATRSTAVDAFFARDGVCDLEEFLRHGVFPLVTFALFLLLCGFEQIVVQRQFRLLDLLERKGEHFAFFRFQG